MNRKIYLLTLFIIIIGHALGQYSDKYYLYKNKFPDEDKVRLLSETNVLIEVVDGKIEITTEFIEEDLYLNNKANYYSERSISYSSFFEISKLQASSYFYKKNKYKEKKVKNFSKKDELSGAAFYDDSKSISFYYPNLDEGSKTKISYIEKTNDPHFLSSVYFQEYCPIIKFTYTITASKDIKLVFKEFNLDSLNIVFTKQEKGNKFTYKWESNKVAKFKMEGGSTNFRNEIGHMIPYISSYKYKNKSIDLLTGVDGLYNWYHSLIKEVNTAAPDTGLVTLVNSLIEGKETELEKVKAIYYWAQKNVKYVAFEYALGGFIPRNANDIYKKKYGDCKDNSSIMKEMLEIANIKSSLTWIGTRSIPYTYTEVPTPVVDNHMILTYMDGNTPYYLDATGRFHPLGLPSSFIQGKEALIEVDSSNYLLKKVPVMEPSYNFLTDTSKLTITDKNLEGAGSVIMNGYQKIDFYNVLENKDSPEKIKDFYRQNFEKGNNKFIITNFSEINKYEYEKYFKIDYKFKIDDYVRGNEKEKYVNLNLSKNVSLYKIKEDQHYDKEFKYKNNSVYVNELTIPQGYKLSYMPENINLKNKKYSASISYKQIGNKVTYVYEVTFNFIVISKDEHDSFNQFIEKLEKAFKESIVLTKE